MFSVCTIFCIVDLFGVTVLYKIVWCGPWLHHAHASLQACDYHVHIVSSASEVQRSFPLLFPLFVTGGRAGPYTCACCADVAAMHPCWRAFRRTISLFPFPSLDLVDGVFHLLDAYLIYKDNVLENWVLGNFHFKKDLHDKCHDIFIQFWFLLNDDYVCSPLDIERFCLLHTAWSVWCSNEFNGGKC